MNFNFEDIFKIPLTAMKINRCHPNIKKDRKWFLHFILNYSIFTAFFLTIMHNIIFLNLKNKQFDQTCKNCVLSVVYFVISFEFFIMIWKQDNLQNLFTIVKKDYEHASVLPSEDQDIMDKYVKQGVHVCRQWLVISVCGCGIFPLKNIVLLTYNWAIGEPRLIPLYDVKFPGVTEENKDNIFVYLTQYSVSMFYGLYAACMYTAFVPLGAIFMLHACGQLDLVQKKIEVIFERHSDGAEERLKEIIKQLQYVYGFVEQILISFRLNYELTLKATTIMLPITCYEVIEAFNMGEVSLEFLTFIVGGILISSSPCYYSDLLMEKGENVRSAMYTSGWESFSDIRIRRTIIVILMRASKPIAVRTIFRTVCLEALTDLFQQAYTIFNLMNAMWK